MTAAACLTLAFIHLSIWARERTRLAHLLFATIALAAAAAMAPIEVLMMRSETVEEFGRAVRAGSIVPGFVAVVAMVWFVRAFLGNRAPVACVHRLRLPVPVTDREFFLGREPQLPRDHRARGRSSFGVNTSQSPTAVFNPWTRLGQLSLLMLVAYTSSMLARRLAPGRPRHVGAAPRS